VNFSLVSCGLLAVSCGLLLSSLFVSLLALLLLNIIAVNIAVVFAFKNCRVWCVSLFRGFISFGAGLGPGFGRPCPVLTTTELTMHTHPSAGVFSLLKFALSHEEEECGGRQSLSEPSVVIVR